MLHIFEKGVGKLRPAIYIIAGHDVNVLFDSTKYLI